MATAPHKRCQECYVNSLAYNHTLKPSYIYRNSLYRISCYTGRIAPKFANQSKLEEAASCYSGYRTGWTGEGLQGLIQGLIT